MKHFARGAVRATALSIVLSTTLAQGPVGLGKVGPVDPAHGFPAWYQDMAPTGGVPLALDLMTNVPGIIDPPRPTVPVSFPTNFPGEAFYFMSSLLMADGPNQVQWAGNFEGTFLQGVPAVGDQVVFSRIRIRVTGTQSGATYIVRHPYGTETLVAGAGGINVTRDLSAIPGNFTVGLRGDVGPFLVPASMTDAQLVGGASLGDGATLTQVRRGLNGQNFVEVEGPGIEAAFPSYAAPLGDDKIRFDQFSLLGRVATKIGSSIDRAYYTRTAAAGTAVNVWATSASAQNLQMSVNSGTAAAPVWSGSVPMVENASTGEYFAAIGLGASNPPSQVRISNLTDAPVSTSLSVGAKVPDLLVIEKALYTSNGVLTVRGRSSDEVSPPTAYTAETSTGGGLLGSTGNLVGVGASVFEGTVTIPNQFAPSLVTVVSSSGGAMQVPVEVNAVVAPPTVQVIANAGPDQTTLGGVVVTLSGANSIGPITHYAWTQEAGPIVALTGANTANPTFVAPTTLNGALAFRLLVSQVGPTGAVLAADTVGDAVLVNVSNPQLLNPDRTTVLDARYDRQRVKWRASGTALQLANQPIRLYLGGPAGPDYTRLVAEAVVDATGNWSYAGGNNTAPLNTRAPIAGVTSLWAVSMFRSTTVPNQNIASSFAFRLL